MGKKSYFWYPLLLIFIVSSIVFSCFPTHSQELKFPRPQGWVSDFADVIPESYQEKISSLVDELKSKTTAEIAVVTVPSLEGETVEMYANKLFKAWGIGDREKDNGVLILLAVRERKIRIETGYGVEGILPDGRVGGIMDQYMVPYLKSGDYGNGLYMGSAAVASVIAEDAGVELSGGLSVSSRPQPRGDGGPSILSIIFFLIIFSIVGFRLIPLLLLGSLFGRGGTWSGGGGVGGGFGGGFGGFGGGASGGGGASRGF